MGNGRKLSGKSSKGGLKWLRALSVGFVLVVAASLMLGGSFRRHADKSVARVSAFPVEAPFANSAMKSKPDARSILGQLPMIFEPNQGQAESGVKFVSRGQGYSLFLDETGAVLAMQTKSPKNPKNASLETVRMTLVGANGAPAVAGSDPLPGKSNYFIGNDPKKWRTGISQFGGVRYQGVYPGIDLVFYGHQGHLEYDFKVAPGADPAQAELKFDGATELELSGGDLILKGTSAGVRLQAPRIYQSVAGQQQVVEGKFVLRAANRVGFEIGSYDRSRELVIDPTIFYSTYFGGSDAVIYPSIAVNGNGEIYLSGSTNAALVSTATTGAVQSGLATGATQNIFVAEIDPTAGLTGLRALTYLGGNGTDTSAGLAVDSGGNAYVAGTTSSTNFPVANGYQSSILAGSTGTSHVFLSELNPTFTALNYSTYLSGNGTDVATGLAVDNNGHAFLTGTTTSSNASSLSPPIYFPASYLPAPYQLVPAQGSTIQFFVTEVNTRITGYSSIAYSTYFGGGNGTIAVGGGIAVDTTDNIYFSGTTNFFNSGEGTNGTGGLAAGDFPIANAYQPCLDTVPPTSFVPPVTCTAPTSPAPTDAFVAKINPNNAQTGASQLLFSTYFGGTGADTSTGITVDPTAANIYITGSTNSSSFLIPTGAGEFQPCLNAPAVTPCPTPTTNTDAYVAKFTNPTEASGTSSTAVGLGYFTYLGGSLNDSGLAIAVDTAGGALVTGETNSTDFPVTTGALQSTLSGANNAFFAHIDTTTITGTTTTGSYATYFGGNGTDSGTSITVDANLNTYIAGQTTSATGTLETVNPLQPALSGTTDAFAVELRPANELCITCILPVLSPSTGVIGAGNPITATFTVSNIGPDLATNITVNGTFTANTAATFTSSSATGAGSTCTTPTGSSASCLIPVLQAGSIATVAFGVTPTTAGTGQITATATNANNTSLAVSTSVSFTSTSYSVNISPSSQTVVAGNTAVYSVLVSPSVTFGNNVTMTCTSLPAGASCGFSPATLTFNGPSPQSSTLNLTTTARPLTTISSSKWSRPFYAFWLLSPAMAVIGFGSSRKRRRWLGLLVILTVLAVIAPLPSCSHTKQQPVVTGTPAGSYPLTVTATSGSFSQSSGFSLTVQ